MAVLRVQRREGLLEYTGVLEIAASKRRRRHGPRVSLVGVGGLFLGFLWGAVMVWISGGVARGRARREAHRADLAERENQRLKTDIEVLEEQVRTAEKQAKDAEGKAAGDRASLPAPAEAGSAAPPAIF